MDADDWALLHKVANDPTMLVSLGVIIFCVSIVGMITISAISRSIRRWMT